MSGTVKQERPVAFVTGASRGIGRAIALELAREGFDIAGNATSYEPSQTERGLGEVKARVAELGGGFLAVAGDVADVGGHERFQSLILDRFGRIDLLVNNAGIAPDPRRDILETTPDSYDRVCAVNARGAFFLTQRLAREMIREKSEDPASRRAIIFVSSISADTSSPSRAEYCIAKAAMSQTARLFADRLATFDIQVYEIRPGIIKTDMTEPVERKYDALIRRGLVPQGRWGAAEDVARAVVALARGDFAYSTGLVLEVSGGMNIRRL